MTHSGRPQAVSRYGIDIKQVGVLAKIAFEQPFDNFFHSATKAEKEEGSGVSFCITVGNIPQLGSGFFGVIDKDSKIPINEDQDLHNFHQKFLNMLQVEQASRPEIKRGDVGPKFLPKGSKLVKSGKIDSSDPSIEYESRNTSKDEVSDKPKKSLLTQKIKTGPFIPALPVINNTRKPNTVTRIVMGDKYATEELNRLGTSSSDVFNSGGKVVEREVEMY
jgi:hypothetical protein